MSNETVKFEAGRTYKTRSICDSECFFTITVIKRTASTLTFIEEGETKRRKIKVWEGVESVRPENYSMAPIFRAENEVKNCLAFA